MNDDHTFRTVILFWLIPFFPLAVFYRIRSQLSGEKLDRRQEGWPLLLTLRPFGALCWFATIAFIINPSWMAWSSLPLPHSLRWAGLGIAAIASTLCLAAFHKLGHNLTDTVVTRGTHRLITSGPYRWVRHPFYDAVLLTILGMSLLTANWFILVTGSAVFMLQVIRTVREEKHLLARFGASYLAYTQRTGRFLPRFKRNHDPGA